VSFLGFQNNPYAYMKASDILIAPSRVEGFPMAIVEALASGLPVIATSCTSGVIELLDNGHYGLLVPPEDPDALSQAIQMLINRPDLRLHFSSLGIKRSKDFDIDRISDQYHRNIQSLFVKPDVATKINCCSPRQGGLCD
jgi:glycosyltransferase involved in cell wall biosynthesis